jgi:hypothetical protein
MVIIPLQQRLLPTGAARARLQHDGEEKSGARGRYPRSDTTRSVDHRERKKSGSAALEQGTLSKPKLIQVIGTAIVKIQAGRFSGMPPLSSPTPGTCLQPALPDVLGGTIVNRKPWLLGG